MRATASTTTASARTGRDAHERRQIPAAVDHGDPVPARAMHLTIALVEPLRDLLEDVELHAREAR
jgi:hypothetical protein